MLNMNCTICGKPIVSESIFTCSEKCWRLWRSRISTNKPPSRKKSTNADVDASSVQISSDNHIQIELFESILDGSNIPHSRNFAIDDQTYDLYLPEIKTLICANTTLSSNMYAVANPIRRNRDRALLASIYGYRCINLYDWDDYIKILCSLVPKVHISAHVCECQIVSAVDADMFYTMYNFDGPYKNAIHYGLFYNDTLIECMSFTKRNLAKDGGTNQYRLSRFCTDHSFVVDGGASKLFKAFIRDTSPSQITAQCDCDKFSGDVFHKIGMTLSSANIPQKIWSKGIETEHGAFINAEILQRRYGLAVPEGSNIDQIMIDQGWSPVMTAGFAKYLWRPTI